MMTNLRQKREQKYNDLRHDLLLLVGVQPEHDIDLATLDDAALVEAGKKLSQRLVVLRESELARQQAKDYDEAHAASYQAAVVIAQNLNDEHPAPTGASWLCKWQLVRHATNEKSSIYAEQQDAVSYARKHWSECKTPRVQRPAAPEELFEEQAP
jgi:hypothetical protein